MRTLVAEHSISDGIVDGIAETRPDIAIVKHDEPAAVVEALRDAEPVALLCNNSAWRDEYLDGLEAGDWVLTKTTGHENYPMEAFRERGILFSNLPGYSVPIIAEHVFGLVLTINRRLRIYHAQQDAHLWLRRNEGMTDLVGDTCCIVGIGRIGEAVAKRARAFEMHVRGIKRSIEGYDGNAHEVFGPADRFDALDGADIVVIALPLTDETRGFVAAEELAACADDAIVVNVARGAILDTDALLSALDAGELRAAGIDVVDNRPPPEDWPLWSREDVVVTPHVAGQSEKKPDRLIEGVLAEWDRWVDGRVPRNVIVDPDGSS